MRMTMFRIEGYVDELEDNVKLQVIDGPGMLCLEETAREEFLRVRDAGIVGFVRAVTDIVGGEISVVANSPKPVPEVLTALADELAAKVQ